MAVRSHARVIVLICILSEIIDSREELTVSAIGILLKGWKVIALELSEGISSSGPTVEGGCKPLLNGI
jgi:hypothetical protein